MPQLIERLGQTLLLDESILDIDGAPAVALRRKRRADKATFDDTSTVLFVHGATYASSITVDLELNGYSWLDRLAIDGFDAWAIDLRGYGNAPRPSEMDAPADAHGPIVTTDVALRDVSHAIDHIRAFGRPSGQSGLDRLNLIGYSWGSRIAGAYASMHSDKLHRLVLYATRLVRDTVSLIGADMPTTSYRLVSREQARDRWRHGLSDAEWADIANPQWVEAWLDALMASDPRAMTFDPPSIRAPTGVVADSVKFADTPYYDPATISAPALVVVGEKDQETTPMSSWKVFDAIADAPSKQFTVIGSATHSMLLERRRDQLFDAVSHFLRRDP
jgi:pimeloyl-ACP methyl ester carboxylesterase